MILPTSRCATRSGGAASKKQTAYCDISNVFENRGLGRHLLSLIAPRFSKRRLLLSMLRGFVRNPLSLIGRLAKVNFHNARVCSQLSIHCCVCGNAGGMYYDYPDVLRRKAHGIGLLRETLLL
jgi:hypothetical protein